ncbi:MAG: GtrA family protein, partial [Tannerellaceae bacterium]
MEITSQTLRQVVKYGVVGLANTLFTALVIWVCMELFLWDPVVSNVVGYAIGLINSFVWNRRWTFRSN